MNASSLDEVLEQTSEEWYEEAEGYYGGVPSWGEETEIVKRLIASSGPDGDIVSWDTTPLDFAYHRYLMREKTSEGNSFRIVSHAEMAGWLT